MWKIIPLYLDFIFVLTVRTLVEKQTVGVVECLFLCFASLKRKRMHATYFHSWVETLCRKVVLLLTFLCHGTVRNSTGVTVWIYLAEELKSSVSIINNYCFVGVIPTVQFLWSRRSKNEVSFMTVYMIANFLNYYVEEVLGSSTCQKS